MQILFCVGKSYVTIHRQMVDRLEKMGAEVHCLMYDQAANKAVVKEAIRDAHVCITAIAPCDREVIEAAPRLRYILKTGTDSTMWPLMPLRSAGFWSAMRREKTPPRLRSWRSVS
ncbi:hypothetical protein [Sporolactobacillus inulinus]|nr:hypothetical protein [Sporolactobacillus inulinus]